MTVAESITLYTGIFPDTEMSLNQLMFMTK